VTRIGRPLVGHSWVPFDDLYPPELWRGMGELYLRWMFGRAPKGAVSKSVALRNLDALFSFAPRGPSLAHRCTDPGQEAP
jgi:hypothetical protein